MKNKFFVLENSLNVLIFTKKGAVLSNEEE